MKRAPSSEYAAEEDLLYWYSIARKTIIEIQHPVTGLIPAHPGSDTWVRDCTYAIHSIWALSLAFEKQLSESNRSIHHELKYRTLKGMRGLLQSLMNQKDKVDKFNASQSYLDCLHAKYETRSGKTTVGDEEWGHLQLDATSLFVLTFAQITSSGYVIVQTLQEVDFIQCLVLYIHYAYRTPDFGVYERGDKNNRGIRELSACSVGMAKAALVAIRNLNLFGAQGGPNSVIYVPPDMSRQCNRVLEAILPRGSKSKEIDSSVWSIISYPAFAVEKDELLNLCKDSLKESLEGQYGYKRFLLDGYKTPLEDTSRLHYNLGELKSFENIECEWPIYLIYEWIDELFSKNMETANKIKQKVATLMVYDEEGYPLVPELYFVPIDKVDEEKANAGSQVRLCGGKIPFIWAQSLYIVAGLMHNDLISASDIDPLNRRLSANKKPASIVQIILLSSDEQCQEFANEHKIPCSSIKDSGVNVISTNVVAQFWRDIGLTSLATNDSRPQRVSSLQTSVAYQFEDKIFVSLPEYSLMSSYYNNLDNEIFIQKTIARLSYLSSQWHFSGRPLIVMLLKPEMFSEKATSRFLDTLKSGSFQGVQVKLCSVQTALTTSFKQQLQSLPPLTQKPDGVYTLSQIPGKLKCMFNTNNESNEEPVLQLHGLNASEKWDCLSKHMKDEPDFTDSLYRDIENLYNVASQEKCWHVIRHCSALLCKVHPSISESVLHILVTQRQISFGEGDNEETISHPPSTAEFLEYIQKHSRKNTILFAIYQEVLLYLCEIIQKNPALFKGILRIRLDLLIRLIAKETSGNADSFEEMCMLRPIEFYQFISRLLSGGVTVSEDEVLTWERIRYIDGSMNRLPKNFHHNLYALLNSTSGIDLNGNVLHSFPLINEMTAGEPQFAISISNWLDKLNNPQLRQLYVEAIMMLGHLQKMMRTFPRFIELHTILYQAHDLFVQECVVDLPENICGISREFYLTPPTGQYGTLQYFTQAITQLYC